MDILLQSEELMARIAEGDDSAFEILVNRHQASVLNLVYRFIGDRTQVKEKVRMMEQGVLGSFIGMLGLVLYNFGRTSLVDIPRILMAAGAFLAIYKKISLSYILLAGGLLSILIYGFLF